MAAARRNLSLAALMLALVAAAALALPSAMWACLVATLLGLAGVVLFRGNGWRTGALLAAAVALSLALLDAFAGLLTPTAYGAGLVRTVEPRWWPQPHPVLGFRPKPNSTAVATATFNGQPVYHTTYHIDSEGGRVTPKAPPGADLYLFLGNSFMFGQGIKDDETLPWLFAERGDGKVRTLNLSAPGNAPNHLVRAFEAGLLDRYAGQSVKAVVVWIIPAQLARTTGDGSWLGSSPRYELVDGKLVHTGSFTEYRLTHPIAGLKYYLGELFPFIEKIGEKQRQEEQLKLFVAMMARLAAVCARKIQRAAGRGLFLARRAGARPARPFGDRPVHAGRRHRAAAQARHRAGARRRPHLGPADRQDPDPARRPSDALHQRADRRRAEEAAVRP